MPLTTDSSPGKLLALRPVSAGRGALSQIHPSDVLGHYVCPPVIRGFRSCTPVSGVMSLLLSLEGGFGFLLMLIKMEALVGRPPCRSWCKGLAPSQSQR